MTMLTLNQHTPEMAQTNQAQSAQLAQQEQSPCQRSDQQLLRDHQHGCSTAFRHLMNRHSRRIWWAVRTMQVPENDHPDIVQESLLRVHRHACKFNGSAQVGTWMVAITRNTAKSYVCSRRGRALPGEGTTPEQLTLVPDKRSEVEEAIARLDVQESLRALPESLRVVMALTGLYGFSEQEVAKRLGIPLGTVKSRKNRARRLLAESLGDDR